ncbi:MAG: D-glycero-beta-D-manno-heptose-7-phosphate kinase, partial [candidate division Zixibacteria bacterium]|nr:D-glycero-beta-D-manno-heptose-7-phosphate kinase [candidate division Zixibacteria bacterium]
MEKANLQEIVGRFGSSRIIILGDVMLDRYIFGEVNRISPEAPAPVVEVRREAVAPGGASNVAANIKALGDTPFVIGVTGDDGADELLRGEFERRCLTADYLIVDKSRKTTLKTRIIAESQQIARIDREQTHEISAEIENEVLTNFEKIAGDAKALIISDYGKGVITESLLERLIPLARDKGLFVAVDPKETHFMNYKDVSLITP